MDVAKYFQNIDKEILYNILQRKIKDEKLLWLTREILYSNGVKRGLPIGNYTSQCFANIYLNELDQYAKHTLKLKYYFRYMDDIVVMGKIINEVKFEFIIKEKNKSIAYFDMELSNKSIVRVKAYNYRADYVFRNYKMNQIVVIKGKIRNDGSIKIC